jgi:hypothetical protein
MLDRYFKFKPFKLRLCVATLDRYFKFNEAEPLIWKNRMTHPHVEAGACRISSFSSTSSLNLIWRVALVSLIFESAPRTGPPPECVIFESTPRTGPPPFWMIFQTTPGTGQPPF